MNQPDKSTVVRNLMLAYRAHDDNELYEALFELLSRLDLAEQAWSNATTLIVRLSRRLPKDDAMRKQAEGWVERCGKRPSILRDDEEL